jgi:hypothetical protein
MANYDFPTEIISLPSQGKCYPESNPLSKGTVEIKYMTAREEEILASQNLVRRGVVIDKLFESIIVEKDINIDDIVLGDKNAILLATRILGYGPEYKIQATNSLGDTQEVIVDLGKVQTKEIDFELLSSENKYKFTTPHGKDELEFKILTHGDESKIDADIKALQRLNKGSVSAELTTRYRYMILSVNGESDTKTMTNFINNKFITRDTKAFREYIAKITPDINMEFDFEDDQTGEVEVRTIPMGVGFFWPTE